MFELSPNGTAFERDGKSDQPVVVLIHGLGLNRHCWQWTRPALRGHYQTLSFDLYGHGDSAAPVVTPSLSMFSNQLRDLLDHCGVERAIIVGFSLGGMIARRFAQDHPTRTEALGILHSPHKRTVVAQDAIVKRVEQAKVEGPSATVEAALERWFTDGFRRHNPDTMQLVRTWVTANDIEIYHRNYNVLATGVDEIVAPEPRIYCPALVVTGDEDYGNGPEMTQAIAEEIDNSEVVILKGLRHMAMAEAPDALNAPLLDFLNRRVG